MDVSIPLSSTPKNEGLSGRRAQTASAAIEIQQYRRRTIFAIWAAAALPMAALAWIAAPALSHHLSGEGNIPIAKALIALLTIGLVWQFALVAILVWREQRSFRWSVLREALWLRAPRSPRTGRVGGRLWLVLIPLVALFGTEELIPSLPFPASHDMGSLLSSHAGHVFLHGAWGWFAVLVALWVFNTVLGEELLFRGLLLPRMNGAFGKRDWLANGVLFACYHLHMPWAIPTNLVDTFALAYPTKRYRSAWIGIAVHSAQSIFFGAIVLSLVA